MMPIQEPLITEATASLKKIDDEKAREIILKTEERAKRVLEEREGVVVSEMAIEDTARDFTIESVVDRA